MADNEDYELLPHEELENLRREVEELKRNPLGNVNHSQDLLTSVQELTKVMHRFTEMMKATNDEMVSDFRRTSVSEHFAQISSQNQKIAEAVLTIAEMVKGGASSQQHNQPVDNFPGMMSQSQSQDPFGQTNDPFSQSNDLPPLNSQPMPSMNQSFDQQMPTQQNQGFVPPASSQPQVTDLPPPEHKKKGLFGK